MSDLWNGFRDLFISALDLLHGLFSFVGDEPAWGFAIIALTLIVRILMLPLAIKQTRSMRAMQQLQPKIKAIQKKYKADRELMRKDPERYKAQRQKMNEEMTALYQEAGVNPAGGCLPLLAQAPIFLALFSVLRTPVTDNPNLEPGSALDQLLRADFYFFTPDATGLSTAANAAGFWGIVLIVLMAASMFWSQRQMMARTAATADGAQLQQQKILMYVMPVFLAVISFSFPMGVLLYWVTTNIWQIAQQAIVLHEVEAHPAGGESDGPGGNGSSPSKPSSPGGAAKGATKGGPKARDSQGKGGQGPGSKSTKASGGSKGSKGSKGPKGARGDGKGTPPSSSRPSSNGRGSGGSRGASDHIPTRRSRGPRN